MYSAALLAVTIIPLGIAAGPNVGNLYCGNTDAYRYEDGCAEGTGDRPTSFYENEPGYTTWQQCKDKCVDDPGCKSIRYLIEGNSPPNILCSHLPHPVSSLVSSCGSYDITNIYYKGVQNFWDAGCPDLSPTPNTVATPAKDALCNPGNQPSMPSFAANQIGHFSNDSDVGSIEACRGRCKDEEGCKAYHFDPYAGPEKTLLVKGGGVVHEVGDYFPECILLADSIAGMTNYTYGAGLQVLWYDVNAEGCRAYPD